MPESVQYRWKLLRAGPLRLDGGSMFGVVPRALWNCTVPCDDQGRIECAHNCLLLDALDTRASREPSGSAARRPRTRYASLPRNVLIDVGSGDKLDAKNRAIFGLSDYSIINAVHDAGSSCDEIDHVIVSHLHFDHAGGLTRAPDARPTFSNAKIHVQRREWDDANANRSVMTRTYLRENLLNIRDHLHLIDSPPPFSPGHLPQRDELPATSLDERETELLPGIRVFNIPGHTWGQHAIKFTDDRGRTVVFSADLIPTAAHVGAAYNMAYDVEPFISTVTRRWFLKEAAAENWLLVLDHEPHKPLQRVREDGKGWFKLVEEAL
jgi:glyoxylase-like metal-dependent hydrolase (beta-lactamase superfamily II)